MAAGKQSKRLPRDVCCYSLEGSCYSLSSFAMSTLKVLAPRLPTCLCHLHPSPGCPCHSHAFFSSCSRVSPLPFLSAHECEAAFEECVHDEFMRMRYPMLARAQDYDGKVIVPEFLNGCACCLFNFVSCGTMTCCPGSAWGELKVTEDGAKIVKNRICFCLSPSPIPCCMYCGFGPCAQVPIFKKVSDTVYEGSGESQLGETGMCTMCCHNKGDKLEVTDGGIIWTAGNSPAYPPCFHNKDVVKMKLKGGGPAVNEMER